MWEKRKGFALIELIVVLAILGLLVMLGMPKYTGYAKEAELTRLKVESRELGEASMKYYMSKGDWPRLSDVAYSKEEVKAFGKRIVDETGSEVELEEGGKYYDIDYDNIGKYISKPEKGYNYVLQNPVGRVYGIEGVEEERKTSYEEVEEEEPEEEAPVVEVIPEIIEDGKPNTAPVPTIVVTTNTNKENKIVVSANITYGLQLVDTEFHWTYTYVDKESDAIRQVEWEGAMSSYPTTGEYVIKLRVQDMRGMWSNWVTRSITVYVMEGEIVEGDTVTASSKYLATTDWGNTTDGTLSGFSMPAFSGWVQSIYAKEQHMTGINMIITSTPAGTITYTVYGLKDGVWLNIGGSRCVMKYGKNVINGIGVTEGDYSGLKVVLSNSASWVGLNEITITG